MAREFKPGDRVRFGYHLQDIFGEHGTVVPDDAVDQVKIPGTILVDADDYDYVFVEEYEIELLDVVTELGELT